MTPIESLVDFPSNHPYIVGVIVAFALYIAWRKGYLAPAWAWLMAQQSPAAPVSPVLPSPQAPSGPSAPVISGPSPGDAAHRIVQLMIDFPAQAAALAPVATALAADAGKPKS